MCFILPHSTTARGVTAIGAAGIDDPRGGERASERERERVREREREKGETERRWIGAAGIDDRNRHQ